MGDLHGWQLGQQEEPHGVWELCTPPFQDPCGPSGETVMPILQTRMVGPQRGEGRGKAEKQEAKAGEVST